MEIKDAEVKYNEEARRFYVRYRNGGLNEGMEEIVRELKFLYRAGLESLNGDLDLRSLVINLARSMERYEEALKDSSSKTRKSIREKSSKAMLALIELEFEVAEEMANERGVSPIF